MARNRTCASCGESFVLMEGEGRGSRCVGCREQRRNKTCRSCKAPYVDLSIKNTRRYCDGCSVPDAKSTFSVNPRVDTDRSRRVRQGAGGRADDLSNIPYQSRTWWGRVGELLYLRLHPEATDSVGEYGNRCPWDATHPELHRVNVKTAKERRTKHGLPSWAYSVSGVSKHCGAAYLIAFNQAQTNVVRAWCVPMASLNAFAEVLTPQSKEYARLTFEASGEDVARLDSHFQVLLQQAPPAKLKPKPKKPRYDRMVFGRLGEDIYQKLHPDSDHEAARNPNATYDFKDADGCTVNVRARALAARSGGHLRWTFFRSVGCTAESYFFIGFDESKQNVLSMCRIPSRIIPLRGFSVNPDSPSKWDVFKLDMGLPKPVSDWVVPSTQLELSSITSATLQRRDHNEIDGLVRRAFSHYRAQGFPYPHIPSDQRIRQDFARVQSFDPASISSKVDAAGVSFCSAYMQHRYTSRNISADYSALGAFGNDDRLMRALRFCLKGKSPGLAPANVRSALTALNRTPVNFRPTVAKALVSMYAQPGDVVFDPCAGWGGRLVGALSYGCVYVGVDANNETIRCLNHMADRLCMATGLPASMYRLIASPIQRANLEGVHAKFAITSPPFWNQEDYAGGVVQASTVEGWASDFLRPMFRRVREVLADGSYFAVHIGDVVRKQHVIPLVQLTMDAADSEGFVFTQEVPVCKASFGTQDAQRFDRVYVFQRGQ